MPSFYVGQTDYITQLNVLSSSMVLPTVAGNSGKYLITDGTNTSWATIPTATNLVLGLVKVDGTTITINNGVISGTPAYSYSLPIATTSVLGGVKVDNTTITINNGVISAPYAYTLPTASTSVLGGVKVDGTSITINGSGVISYTLPTASTSVLGGVKVDGSTLAYNASGQLYYTGLPPGGIPVASTSVLGGVKVDGTTITINNGVISILLLSPTLTTPTLGVASATTINKVAITAPANGSTLTIADGKTLTASNTLTFTGTDASSVNFSSGGTVVYTSNKLSVHSSTTSAELASIISDETGSGSLVFSASPTFTGILSAAAISANTVSSNNNIAGYSTTITNTLTTTLTNSSNYQQYFTGTATQIVVLPVTSTLVTGQQYQIVNNSTGNITVQSSGLNTVLIVPASTSATFTVTAITGTSAASWYASFNGFTTVTGTGTNVLATSPVLVTPTLGVASATTINKVAITTPATGSTLTIAEGKTLTASNTLTFTGTDASSVNFSTGGTVAYTANKLSAFAATTSAELLGIISDETGSGSLVFSASPTLNSPTLVTPTLGVASATTINKVTITTPASGSILTIADNKTLTVNNTLAFTGTDASSINFGIGGTVVYTGSKLSVFAATTSSELAGVISDETGSGALVFATSPTLNSATLTSPTLTTPTLGIASATTINKVTITTPITGSTLTIADNKILTVNNTLTFTGTDLSSVNFSSGGTVAYTANKLSVFAATTSSELAGVISDETGTGALVFATSPTLVTPTLGVASATTINKVAITAPATGSTLTIAEGKTLTASNTLTFTGTDLSSVNFSTGGTVVYTSNKLSAFAGTTSSELASIISDETGSGALVFSASPTLTTPTLGIASATTINKVAITTPATGSTLTIADGKTLTASNTLTFTGTDLSSVNFSTGGTVVYTSNKLSVFAATTSSELAGVISDETGSGALVFGTSPAITTSLTTPSTNFALLNTTATTVNFAGSATTLNIGASSGITTINNDLTISGNLIVNGTTTTINATTISVDDINITLGSTASPTDVSAVGGGITLKGATDKYITWSAANGWTSSEPFNIVGGKTFKISGIDVLSGTTLGSGVTTSSLTSVATIGTGTWEGTIIAGQYGGTGVANTGKTITLGGNLTTSGAFDTTFTATGITSLTLPTSGILATTSNKLSAFAATTSAELLGIISDETGTGSLVFATSPTLVTPTLGVASATTINKVAITAPATGSTLTIAEGKTLTASNTLTFTGTDLSSVNFSTGGTVVYTSNKLSVHAATTSSELASIISDETGTGSLVFATSPTLITPVLGIASATTINKVAITTPATGSTLTIADGKTLTASNTLTFTGTDASSVSFGSGGTVAYTSNKLSAFAATTSAELLGIISDETGTGSLVFATSPAITTSLTTPSTSFALLNTTATTINAFGAASALSMGAGYGTTTINNDLIINGNFVVNGSLSTTINRVTITAPATASTLTIADGKTLTASNTLTFTGTDASSVAFGSGGTVAYTSNKLSAFAGTTSTELASIISDETGSGSLVFATSPALVTPTLGVASATTINKVTITAPSLGSTLTIANDKILTVNNTLTFTGTDLSSVNFSTGGTVAYTANKLSAFAATTSTELASIISNKTGTGNLVFAASPTFSGVISLAANAYIDGLQNVDNTRDLDKPVSTATNDALNLRAPKISPTFTGITTAAAFQEYYTVPAIVSNIATLNYSQSAIFYLTGLSANFTAAFTNVPTTAGYISTATLIIVQGVTTYGPSSITINGVAQTIKWQGGAVPLNVASRVNLLTYSFIQTTPSTWTVIGNLTSYA
ncbi:hypothetical protein EB001_02020 [bacterium]|nr:hypothetical protein [bacterium]